ncbi:hypothetical protein ACQP2F_06020 [Actinoplanes sp. CA-030573]|uniref:hypothetical protein n=1 Tax=Actinoplanes sp. CA-030573 TaxID=3239898 RepID=UPI003D8D464A
MPENEPSAAANDAIWLVESTDFVTPYAPLAESVFDDAERLNAAWELTVSSLSRDSGAAGERGGTDDPGDDVEDDLGTPEIIQRLQHHMRLIAEERAGSEPAAGPEPRMRTRAAELLDRLLRRPGADTA